PVEIPVGDRERQALPRPGRAGLRVLRLHRRAHEAWLELTAGGAAVAVDGVAVVAGFAGVDVAVAAGGGAGAGGAALAAVGLRRAGLGAAAAIAVEQAVVGARVARLAGFDDAVATDGLRASGAGAGPAGLGQTRA